MERAKLFKIGQSQAVRLPKKLGFSGREVYAKKVGRAVLLIPIDDPWQPLREGLGQFSEDFLSDRPAQLAQRRDGIEG